MEKTSWASSRNPTRHVASDRIELKQLKNSRKTVFIPLEIKFLYRILKIILPGWENRSLKTSGEDPDPVGLHDF